MHAHLPLHRGKTGFNFKINSRPVCFPVFQASLGVSASVISRMMWRVQHGKQSHKDSVAQRGVDKHASDSTKKGTVVGWLLWYAQECGQDCPERGCIVLPHVEIRHMHSEYEAEMLLLGKDKDTLLEGPAL